MSTTLKYHPCINKLTGHLGTITKELKGNSKFPDQWGIVWEKPGHYFWNDKENILILGGEIQNQIIN